METITFSRLSTFCKMGILAGIIVGLLNAFAFVIGFIAGVLGVV